MIICKRPVPLNDHLQPQKGHEKSIFDTLHNDIKCVLGITESKFNGKNRSTFSHLLTVRAEVADPPPLTVSLTVKCPFFDGFPYELCLLKSSASFLH